MKRLMSIALLMPVMSFAADKVDWSPCKKEIDEYCTTMSSDQDKHKCIEEDVPKSKLKQNPKCEAFNKSLEAKLGDKHDHKH